ncbi:MAG: hypothetical protein EOO63_17725 [Hymenobacter sp.]|nr:MAG: hypothetical protein EOO63_17725 [Hymenobacter sp.]
MSVALAATLAIQVGREMELRSWPQQRAFHQRIQFVRIEHAVPVFAYPGRGSNRFLPYLGTANSLLHSNDSISKQLGDDRFFLIRDSAVYRVTNQWVWNKTTRDFEFAGRDSTKL